MRGAAALAALLPAASRGCNVPFDAAKAVAWAASQPCANASVAACPGGQTPADGCSDAIVIARTLAAGGAIGLDPDIVCTPYSCPYLQYAYQGTAYNLQSADGLIAFMTAAGWKDKPSAGGTAGAVFSISAYGSDVYGVALGGGLATFHSLLPGGPHCGVSKQAWACCPVSHTYVCDGTPPAPTPPPPPAPTPPPAPAGATAWWADGRALMRGDASGSAAFYVRGFAYHPVPVGGDPLEPSNPEYGFDALSDPQRCASDFARMRGMGANALRVYNTNVTSDWAGCLDAAWNGGAQPLAVVMCPWVDQYNWPASGPSAKLVSDFTAIVSRTHAHPAVMGYSVGAEGLPFQGAGFWGQLDALLAQLRSALGGSQKVFTIAPSGWAAATSGDAAASTLDMWGADDYIASERMMSTALNSCQALLRPKPCVLMEYGFPSSTRTTDTAANACAGDAVLMSASYQPAVAAAFNVSARALVRAHDGTWGGGYAAGLLSGGMVFEFSDEWWKAANPSRHDPGYYGSATGDGWRDDLPGHCRDEEWYGVFTRAADGTLSDTLAVAEIRAAWAL